MENLQNKAILITGGSSGLGKALVHELVRLGAHITVIARNAAKLEEIKQMNVSVISGDATDPLFMDEVIGDLRPAVTILNAGATPVMGPLDELSWEDFSTVWNTDVKAGLYGIQSALKAPLRRGSRVLAVSSGAAMRGAPLSGSYAGAKHMLGLMVQYANQISYQKDLGIVFQTIVPLQMIGETALAQCVAGAYIKGSDITLEQYIEKRYGHPLSAQRYAELVTTILINGVDTAGTAYGIHHDTGVTVLD
ncbi:MAG: SDR family oxidoreductase [Chitinophaga sp.]|uniref:SDR family NAD(P)-dependent oxidoreductase n=1 Tax=Chitinophaga sp. TaxID=1869181 RepID=UPI001B0C2C09|nr:SDR family oxidoreductase [Chitinophaga sp.]MBO9728351.1 SDR family oxidoreductase [Chitinophaga sp.]